MESFFNNYPMKIVSMQDINILVYDKMFESMTRIVVIETWRDQDGNAIFVQLQRTYIYKYHLLCLYFIRTKHSIW